MTKKQIAQKKDELCELQVEAIKHFKNLFKGKQKELKHKNENRPKP